MDAAVTLEEPGPDVAAVAARHLRERHGYPDFDPRRDVRYEGHAPGDAVLDWDAQALLFRCERCSGLELLPSGEERELERQRRAALRAARRRHPALQPFLAGLETYEARDEMADRFFAGELGPAVLAEARRRQRRQPPVKRQQVAAERRQRCQQEMLRLTAEEGLSLSAILTRLDAMRREDPDRFAFLTLARNTSVETLRKDWQAIPAAAVAAARAHFERRAAKS